jgi:hypothetical protein
MRLKATTLSIIFSLQFFSGLSHADVVNTYNNFSSTGDIYSPSGGWIGDRFPESDSTIHFREGNSFQATVTGNLVSISTGLHRPSTSEEFFNLSIYNDNAGFIGNTAVWSQEYSFGDLFCCIDFTTTTDFLIDDDNILLTAGEIYWLVVETSFDVAGDFSWSSNNTGARGGYNLGRFNEGSGRILDDTLSNATLRSFSIAVNAVPVPAAVWLFGSALIGLLIIGRSKNKHVFKLANN